MTHPQHKPREGIRPVSEAERNEARRRIQSLEASKDDWWKREAYKHLVDALRETLDDDGDALQRIIEAGCERDFCEIGALVWARVHPWLDDQCIKAHDPEA